MQNYMMVEDKIIQTSFGIFYGVETCSHYSSGEIESLTLSERNMVVTEVGGLIPAYTQNERRKNKPSVAFSKAGMVISVALEEQQEIETPIGDLPVEYVKFYDTGELHRIHILDGQISGFWTIEDERERNIPLSFDLGITEFTAMLDGICFYRNGAIKSVTLFPGEEISVLTPHGNIPTKIGLALYDNGAIKSVEPSEPVILHTAIGKITAYDCNQVGIHADSNSLAFTQAGQIESLITCDNAIYVQTEDEAMEKFTPTVKIHPLYDDQLTVEGMKVHFNYEKDTVTIKDRTFPLQTSGFTIQPFLRPGLHCTPEDCANCSLCNK